MSSMMNSLFDDFFRLPVMYVPTRDRAGSEVAVDVAEDEKGFTVKANVPGLKKENIEIEISEDALVLKGNYDEEKDEDRQGYRVKERRTGSFTRVLPINVPVDVDKAEAKIADGVLEVVIPKILPEAPKSKKLEISDK
jgi:HSP20 family protein